MELTLKERMSLWEQMENRDVMDFPIGDLSDEQLHGILDKMGVPRTNEKKPDIVVWNQNRGYYASKLPYGSDLGAPVIKPDDVEGWKTSSVIKANKHFESKFNSLKKEFEKFIQEVTWTEMVYKAKYNFEPIIGNSYYLYLDKNENPFLSLIGPDEWKQSSQYIGEFKLDHRNCWEKVNRDL